MPAAEDAVIDDAQSGDNFLAFSSGRDRENRIGIYARGGCDLRALFAAVPSIRRVLNGTCCILRDGIVADSRSDLLLQGLEPPPNDLVEAIIRTMKLRADYFRPTVFDSTFVMPGSRGPEEFPKKIVILSIASDVVRVMYRHREHPVLVDPGGTWFRRPMSHMLADPKAIQWFKEYFVSIGRIGPDDFSENFARIVTRVKTSTGAHVLVFNLLNPEPRGLIHNYQFVKDPLMVRRREFNLALVELSRRLDFSIVDVDRVLQREGVRNQQDWAHHHPAQYPAMGEELFRILQELEVFS